MTINANRAIQFYYSKLGKLVSLQHYILKSLCTQVKVAQQCSVYGWRCKVASAKVVSYGPAWMLNPTLISAVVLAGES